MEHSGIATQLHVGYEAKGLLHALPPGYENASGHWTHAASLCGVIIEMPPTPAHVTFSFGRGLARRQKANRSGRYGRCHPRGFTRSRRLRRQARKRSMDAVVCRRCRKQVRRMTHPRWTAGSVSTAA
jgi:hypothetical protein